MHIWQDITKEIRYEPLMYIDHYYLALSHKYNYLGYVTKNNFIYLRLDMKRNYKIVGNSFYNFKILEKVKKDG